MYDSGPGGNTGGSRHALRLGARKRSRGRPRVQCFGQRPSPRASRSRAASRAVGAAGRGTGPTARPSRTVTTAEACARNGSSWWLTTTTAAPALDEIRDPLEHAVAQRAVEGLERLVEQGHARRAYPGRGEQGAPPLARRELADRSVRARRQPGLRERGARPAERLSAQAADEPQHLEDRGVRRQVRVLGHVRERPVERRPRRARGRGRPCGTRPASGRSTPATSFSSVDLPQPFGPTSSVSPAPRRRSRRRGRARPRA